MARERPTASDVSQSLANPDAAGPAGLGRDDADALTLAQARALRRCSPLSTTEFKAQREVIAQQHRWSVMRILRRADDDNFAVSRGEQRFSRSTKRHN